VCNYKPSKWGEFDQGRNVIIVVDASDRDGGVKEVRFFVDGFQIFVDREAPYRCVWETTQVDTGTYTISAKAFDIDMEQISDQIQITLTGEVVYTELQMIDVEGGPFTMGCTAEQTNCFDQELPAHDVSVSSFQLSKHEITNHQYAQFLNQIEASENGVINDVEYIHMNAETCQISYRNEEFIAKSGYENYPVVEVSWVGANAFCEHFGGRLPTEAEWEYAARGGNRARATEYAGSDTIYEVAWYSVNSNHSAQKVGTKYPNELGLQDMSGNVWEWCSDWYSETYYAESPEENPTGPEAGVDKVLRGGIWNGDAKYCRVAYRAETNPIITNAANGFRLRKDL
jgi:sulfatase modifying factor 1